MNSIKLFRILTYYLVAPGQQIIAQFGGIGYNPYSNSGIGDIFARANGYSTYGYYPQYPMYGSYPCFTSIFCGGSSNWLGGYPYYQNGFNTAFSSSSSSSGFSFGLNGGFFG